VISIESDLLLLQQGANPLKLPLVANSETLFVSRTDGDTVEFIKDAQGGITGFIYHRGGSPDRKATRKK
jgi:hypothetical protein